MKMDRAEGLVKNMRPHKERSGGSGKQSENRGYNLLTLVIGNSK
jgi:hypothetical protein